MSHERPEMSEIKLDPVDGDLLDLLQSRFPLVPRPYTGLGLDLGLSEDQVIRRVQGLREAGIIRQIGPVLDAGSLGYRTTLVAMKVSAGRIESAERGIAAHSMVSHGYEREHELNIWFTLAVPPGADADEELRRIAGGCQADTCFPLPALKVFKLNAYFGMGGRAPDPVAPVDPVGLPHAARLSNTDKRVLTVLQQDLPIVAASFAGMAGEAGMTVMDFLAACHDLKNKGVIRRFGAAINHRRAGFTANAMACWAALPETVDALGKRLAGLPQVSHCYERAVNPAWRYNVFAMVHGHERESCREIASRVARETGLHDFCLLFSTREFKKARVKYSV